VTSKVGKGRYVQAKITKRIVDAAKPRSVDQWPWDSELKGFGLRVRPSGRKVYILEYRPGFGGRGVQKRRLTIGLHGSPWTPNVARKEAQRLLGLVATGHDPTAAKSDAKTAPTVADLAARFLGEHVKPKRKTVTARR
jgi:hypothetical protein